MKLFKRKGFSIIKFILFIVVAAFALYLLFRGIVHETIVSGIN